MSNAPSAERHPLTAKQAEVYWSIVRHYSDDGGYPSIRELCRVLKISSTNGVIAHIKALAKKGWIVWDRTTKSRGIRIPELVEAARRACQSIGLRESSRSSRGGATTSSGVGASAPQA